MEEGDDEEHRPLDIEGRDRVHTLFSGTTVVVASPGPPVTSQVKARDVYIVLSRFKRLLMAATA